MSDNTASQFQQARAARARCRPQSPLATNHPSERAEELMGFEEDLLTKAQSQQGETTKLLPCPFCRANAILAHETIGDYQDNWWVVCCSCRSEGRHSAEKHYAVSSWNHRRA